MHYSTNGFPDGYGPGHPIEGVFMKCWRCQKTRRLELSLYHDNGNPDSKKGELRCPDCKEGLIPLEGEDGNLLFVKDI